MSDESMDLDTVVEDAWRGFREALADALSALEDGEVLRVAVEGGDELTDGAARCVESHRVGDSIAVQVPGNRLLATHQRLTTQGRRHLRELGFAKPTDRYLATYPAGHVDHAASVTVSTVRLVFGVVHPAFLYSDDVVWVVDSPLPAGVAPQVPVAVHPVDDAHLALLVDRALTPVLGHAPERDSDGDVPVPAGSAVVFVRTDARAPVVRLFALMVVEISDVDAAVREVDVLNRDIMGVKFALHGDMVIASADVLAWPFAAEHLQAWVTHMCDAVSGHDRALAARVGGRVFVDLGETVPDEDDDEDEQSAGDDMPPVMLSLLQLDAGNPGALRPRDAAQLCGYDSDLLLDLIRWNEEQEIAWRQARDEATTTGLYDEAEVCEVERAHARRTVRLLRKALRRVLLG